MTVLVLADLHLDLWAAAGRDPLAGLDPSVWASLEALIVAGDLSNKPKVRWSRVIAHLAQYIAPERIFLIPGNHDYYDHVIDGEDRLAEIAQTAGAQLVQKRVVTLGRTRFLCCTLWTDFDLHGVAALSQARARDGMNDYRYIRNAAAGYRRLSPHETAEIHRDHRAWLDAALSQPFAGRTVVVTHHCPHPALIAQGLDDLAPAYGTDLTSLIAVRQPDLWLFGHTHHSGETQVGHTLVRNVSLGYPDQMPASDLSLRLRRGLF